MPLRMAAKRVVPQRACAASERFYFEDKHALERIEDDKGRGPKSPRRTEIEMHINALPCSLVERLPRPVRRLHSLKLVRWRPHLLILPVF